MRPRSRLAWLVVPVLAGCSAPTPPACGTGALEVGNGASVVFAVCQGRVLAAAWSDISLNDPGAGVVSTTDRGPGRSACAVTVGAGDGRAVVLQAESPDGTAWTVTVNGRAYRLEDGAAFLVATRGGATRVTQVRADLSGVQLPTGGVGQPSVPDLARAAEGVPEVKAFLARARAKE